MFEPSRSNTEYTQSSFALTAVRMCDGSSPTTWVPRFLQSPDQLFRKCSAFMLFYFICVASEFSLVWHFLIYFSFLHWKKGKEMKRRESQDSGFTLRRVYTLKAGTHPLWAVLLFTAHHIIFSLCWNCKLLLSGSLNLLLGSYMMNPAADLVKSDEPYDMYVPDQANLTNTTLNVRKALRVYKWRMSFSWETQQWSLRSMKSFRAARNIKGLKQHPLHWSSSLLCGSF